MKNPPTFFGISDLDKVDKSHASDFIMSKYKIPKVEDIEDKNIIFLIPAYQ
jgi:hypothetical protein